MGSAAGWAVQREPAGLKWKGQGNHHAASAGSACRARSVYRAHSARRAGRMARPDARLARRRAALPAVLARAVSAEPDLRRAELSGPRALLAERPAEPDPRPQRIELRRKGDRRRRDGD